MSREPRPPDDAYFEIRSELLSQGDVFADVPLAYPMPAQEIVEQEAAGTGRRFLSGPLDFGMAMLITPTCSIRSRSGVATYAHAVRTLVPVVRLDRELKDRLSLDTGKLGLLRKYDGLINYMYLPPSKRHGVDESLAFLYMPVTVHHDMIAGQRVTQLAIEGAKQFQRKLVWFTSGYLVGRETFMPPMD